MQAKELVKSFIKENPGVEKLVPRFLPVEAASLTYT